jgi:hypothetical protein
VPTSNLILLFNGSFSTNSFKAVPVLSMDVKGRHVMGAGKSCIAI